MVTRSTMNVKWKKCWCGKEHKHTHSSIDTAQNSKQSNWNQPTYKPIFQRKREFIFYFVVGNVLFFFSYTFRLVSQIHSTTWSRWIDVNIWQYKRYNKQFAYFIARLNLHSTMQSADSLEANTFYAIDALNVKRIVRCLDASICLERLSEKKLKWIL